MEREGDGERRRWRETEMEREGERENTRGEHAPDNQIWYIIHPITCWVPVRAVYDVVFRPWLLTGSPQQEAEY